MVIQYLSLTVSKNSAVSCTHHKEQQQKIGAPCSLNEIKHKSDIFVVIILDSSVINSKKTGLAHVNPYHSMEQRSTKRKK